MKHQIVINVECSDNLDREDIITWLEKTFETIRVFFSKQGEVYKIDIEPERKACTHRYSIEKDSINFCADCGVEFPTGPTKLTVL
jgi:arsenate reductase-like glutaredoxin family protein